MLTPICPRRLAVPSPTTSEQQFELLCQRLGLRLDRIPVGSRRTPDYVLRRGSSTAIVELKQFDDSAGDRRCRPARDAQLSAGQTVVVDHATGLGIGRAISDSTAQFKAIGSSRPCLLVIYNNRSFDNQTMDFDLSSMFGTMQIQLARTVDGKPEHVGAKHAGGRKLTPSQNTTISAIAILKHERSLPQHPPVADLRVYHNPFARRPLSQQLFACLSGIDQFAPDNDPSHEYIRWRPL